MPEGHTISRLAARHRDLFVGRRVTLESPQGRFADGAALLSGRILRSTEAYGKHLLHHFSGDLSLHMHLGLYGKFTDGAAPLPPVVGEVRLRMYTRKHWLDLRGPATCEVLEPVTVAKLLGRLGTDPLRDDSDPEVPYVRIARSVKPVAGLLLDQSIVAGAGLIYVTEVLFRAGISPFAPGRSIPPEAWPGIWDDLRTLMRAGVLEGRIDTVGDEHTPEAMGRAPRVDRHGGEVYVYRRAGQPCLVCGTPIARGVLAGRNLYWCPVCQPVR